MEANNEVPKGFEVPAKFARCGIDPARSLDSRAALLELFRAPLLDISDDSDVGLNGLVEGVGREVLESSVCWTLTPLVPTGENLEGTVPALVRREGFVTFISDGGTRSGNPS